MGQFQKIKGGVAATECWARELDNGSVAEEAECKVSSKCVARTLDNGSVPEKLGCKAGEKLVNKKIDTGSASKKTQGAELAARLCGKRM